MDCSTFKKNDIYIQCVMDINDIMTDVSHNRSAKTVLQKVEGNLMDYHNAFKGLCETNNSVYNGLFCNVFSDEYKLDVLSDFLSVDKLSLKTANRKGTVYNIATQALIYNTLYEIFKLLRTSFGITLKEIVLAWSVINSTPLIIEIMSSNKSQTSLLEEAIQKKIQNKQLLRAISSFIPNSSGYEEEDEQDVEEN